MRHPALVAFAVTTATMVPAGLFALDAGPAQRAKLFANKAKSLDVDDAHVDVALDKAFVNTGGTVHVKLTADKPTKVAVVVVGTVGTENQRVESPPRAIAHEVVELTADEYGKIGADLPVVLTGAELEGNQALAHYSFFVMAPDVADKFENWRKARSDGGRRRAVAGTGELAKLTNNIEATWTPADMFVKYKAKTIASLDAYARDYYSGFFITAPNRVTKDEAFVAAVKIKNPTKKAISANISMRTPPVDEHYFESDTITIEQPEGAVELNPGETKTVEFKITARAKGTLALQAILDCGSECKLYASGAFEAVDIVEPKKIARR